MQEIENLVKIDSNVSEKTFVKKCTPESAPSKIESDEKSFLCDTCQSDFPTLSTLTGHFRDFHITQTTKTSYLCGLCLKTLKLTKDINRHFQKEHAGHTTNTRVGCETEILSEDLSFDLPQSHANVKHCCDICHQEFSSKDCLSVHHRIHAAMNIDGCVVQPPENCKRKSEKSLFCKVCREGFVSMSDLKNHVRRTHSSKVKSPVCEVCKAKFAKISSLMSHILRCHDGENLKSSVQKARNSRVKIAGSPAIQYKKKSIKISHNICAYKCNGEQTLRKMKYFMCKTCDIRFHDSSKWEDHFRNVHKTTPYACDLCDKRYPCKSSFYRHCKMHFAKHRCNVCQKEFSSKSYLLVHLRTHTGEKPFPCICCNKTFISTKQLKIHFRVHSGEKPYVCETCGRAFARKHHLCVHERLHSGEKPFVCDICQRGFTRKWVMEKHRRLHTGERPFECDVCQKGFISSSHLKTHRLTHGKASVGRSFR